MAYLGFKRGKNPHETLQLESYYYSQQFYKRLEGVTMRDWIDQGYWNGFEMEADNSIQIDKLYDLVLDDNILGRRARAKEDLYLLPMRWKVLPVQVKEYLLNDSTYQSFKISRANTCILGKMHPRYAFEYFMYGLLSFGNSKSLINSKTMGFLSAWYRLI